MVGAWGLGIVVGIIALAYFFTKSGVGPAMGKLTADEIRDYASTAGFQGNDLDTAVAIALAESGGDPGAVGDVALGGSVGLWQIYTVAHPEFALQDLTDPQVNANAAYSVYLAAKNSFRPWTTFKTGAYQAFLGSSGIGDVSS